MLLWLSLLFKRRRSSPHNVESAGRLTCAFYNLQLFQKNSTNGAVVVSQYSTVAIDLKNGIVIRQEESGLEGEEDFRLERYAVETKLGG